MASFSGIPVSETTPQVDYDLVEVGPSSKRVKMANEYFQCNMYVTRNIPIKVLFLNIEKLLGMPLLNPHLISNVVFVGNVLRIREIWMYIVEAIL